MNKMSLNGWKCRLLRLAAVEGTELAVLLTTHRYIPSSLSETAAIMYEAELAPVAILTVSFCHWYMRLSPVAETVKVAGCPDTTNVSETGWPVITAGSTAEGWREGGREGGRV